MHIAVLGAGLIGSAAARHLALAGAQVTLIGPPEPLDWGRHDGVFGSHYDEGRITRGLDAMPFWATVSRASMARYDEIAELSGIPFFSRVGGLMAGLDVSDAATGGVGVAFDRIAPIEARGHGYHLPKTVSVLHEPAAGHISPRRLVAAQQSICALLGVERREETVRHMSAGRVQTEHGTYQFDQVLWAAGGFGAPQLNLPLSVQARTVAFFEVSEEEAERRAGMPTLILEDGRVIDIYLLPPIRYPNKKWYFKIGGGPHDRALDTEAEMRAWYRSGGDAEAARQLAAIFRTLVPDAEILSEDMAPCVTTYTPDQLPAIGRLDAHTCVATAGNGRGAKCSDELGRLGAAAVLKEAEPGLDPCRFNV